LSEGAITRPINVITTSGLVDKLKVNLPPRPSELIRAKVFSFFFAFKKEQEETPLHLNEPALLSSAVKREIPDKAALYS
jgi:hypothetical protein